MKRYRLVLADPPWKPDDALPGETRGAAKNYDVMTVEEICAYPLPPIDDDALLLLWRVAWMPEEAHRVVRAWGFVPKSEVVWAKTTAGGGLAFLMGRYVRNCHETCIIAGRGRSASLVIDKSIRSVFFAELGAHSEKPEFSYQIAERLSVGPRVELFARGPERRGWDRFGREAIGAPEHP